MAADWPFLGRQREVDAVVAACSPGRGGVVIAGPAGVGKTSIADAARRRLRAQGRGTPLVLATASAARVPYGVFPPAQGPGGPASSAAAILGAGTDAVCLIDDAHLLDRRSAALVRRLAADGGITVVLTVRTGEPVPDDVTAVWRDGLLARLDVAPLADADLLAAAESFLGGPLDASAAERLTRLSAGNALYLRLLVEGQRASGRLTRVGKVWRWHDPGLPPALVELVSARLDALPATVREVLDIVALASPLDVATLSGLTSRAAVERAERHGAIAVDDGAGGTLIVRAAHPLYAEVALARLPRLRARRMRARIVTRLARHGGTDPAAVLQRAALMLDADLPADPDLLARGAELAVTAGDTTLADRLSTASLEAGGGFAAQSVRAFVRAWAGHDLDVTVRELSRLAQLARTPEQAVYAVVNQAMSLAWEADDADAARAVLDAALTRWPGFAVLSACATIIDVYRVAGDTTISPDRARTTPDATTTAIAAAAVAADAAVRGRHHDFRAAVEGCLGAAAASSDPAGFGVSVTPLMIRGFCLAGEIAEARRLAGARLDAAVGREPFAQLLGCMAADAALAAGAARTARGLLDQAWAGLLAFGDAGPWRSICAAESSRASALLGEPRAARTWYERAVAARQRSFALLDVDLILTHAGVTAAEGASAEAARLALRAADLARERGHGGYEVVALQSALQLGTTGLGDRVEDAAAGVEGPRAGAARRFAAALDDRDATALRDVSADYERLGDLIAAADAAALAAAGFDREGARPLAQEARIRVRRLSDAAEGVRTGTMRRCLQALPLTSREWEIAELAARGGSSRDIARRLVLSVRTVEGHLYRIYPKLGITGRDELAAVMGAEDE